MSFLLAIDIQNILDQEGNSIWSKIYKAYMPQVVSIIICAILSLIVFYIGKKIIKIIDSIFIKAANKRGWDEGVKTFGESLIKYILYVVLFIIILGIFGIKTTSITAAIGAAGLTVGLALQGALSNFAGGVLILIMKPFVVGDYIIEAATGNEGTVSKINVVYTTLVTVDGVEIQIPNGALAGTAITNTTSVPYRMINECVSISYKDNLEDAKEVLNKVAENSPFLDINHPIKVLVKDLGDNAVTLCVRYWVDIDKYWDAKAYTLEEIKKGFDKANIELFYNKLDVNIINSEK